MCDKLYLKKGYCNPRIDVCLRKLIQFINKSRNYKTVASCCGHNVYPMTIVIKSKDNRVFELISKRELKKQKRNRYYKTDKENYYYIPEDFYL